MKAPYPLDCFSDGSLILHGCDVVCVSEGVIRANLVLIIENNGKNNIPRVPVDGPSERGITSHRIVHAWHQKKL